MQEQSFLRQQVPTRVQTFFYYRLCPALLFIYIFCLFSTVQTISPCWYRVFRLFVSCLDMCLHTYRRRQWRRHSSPFSTTTNRAIFSLFLFEPSPSSFLLTFTTRNCTFASCNSISRSANLWNRSTTCYCPLLLLLLCLSAHKVTSQKERERPETVTTGSSCVCKLT